MLRSEARYSEGLVFARLKCLNPDMSIPMPTRVVGGIGPFDFSKAAVPAAVVLKWKIDAGAELSDTVDLSSVGDIGAVTVDELVAAVTTSAPTGLTASKEAVTGRFKLAMTTPGAAVHFQVYGEVAIYSGIGQGYGTKFFRADTSKSFQDTPTVKAEETLTNTDAEGKDVEISTDGYRKGFVGTWVDTARDPKIRALMEGGVYNENTKVYEAPTSESNKAYFQLELYYKLYVEGSHKEADIAGYVKKLFRSCRGAFGQVQHQRGWADHTYTITGTLYVDEAGMKYPDTQETELTVAAFEALNLANV